MELYRISAFSVDEQGGNPAGVAICDTMPSVEDMQRIASDVGYSETAFVVPKSKENNFRVRYFAPESEVPFCGHATIALGAVLGELYGLGRFELTLNDGEISVETFESAGEVQVALQSPPTSSWILSEDEILETIALFGLSHGDLNLDLPPAYINAGASHFVIALNSREKLKNMNYDFAHGRDFMKNHNLVTVMLGFIENDQNFHVRNAFASGGVVEDPATGAAAAALSGYLRDQEWPHGGKIKITQGEDMGAISIITAEFENEKGSSIRISGNAHKI